MLFDKLVVSIAVVLVCLSNVEAKKRSVVQMISDGFGPASETLARDFLQVKEHKSWDNQLPLDKRLIGQISTRSTDSFVTDSAASATAYSCGLKSVNGYIGVDVDAVPCGTILEAAKAKDFHTALVTTSRVTHATPASWSSHIYDRDLENEIAEQQLGNYTLGRQVDILWGGGRRQFVPKSVKGSSREDDLNLIEKAQQDGWTVVQNQTEFETFKKGENVSFPSLGLFTMSHMAYEIDRVHEDEPSLTEMSIAALNALHKADKPFFIMIEGARIDHAGHNNDPVGHIYDIIEYNKAFEAVSKWIDEHDTSDDEDGHEILLVSTSDHECGGLALSWQRPEDKTGEYAFYPDALLNATHSTEYLANLAFSKIRNDTSDARFKYMKEEIVEKNLGIHDVSDDEINRAVELLGEEDIVPLTLWLSSILNWRAQLDWSSDGHSGVDVNLYMHQKNPKKEVLDEFRGNHVNTWIANFTQRYLDLDLDSVSRKLNHGNSSVPGSGSSNHSTPTGAYKHTVNRLVMPDPFHNGRGRRSHFGRHD